MVSYSPARLRVLLWTLCHVDDESTSLELIPGPWFCSPAGVIVLSLWCLKPHTPVTTKTRKRMYSGLLQPGGAVTSWPVGLSDIICRWTCCRGSQANWHLGKQRGRPNPWVPVSTGCSGKLGTMLHITSPGLWWRGMVQSKSRPWLCLSYFGPWFC